MGIGATLLKLDKNYGWSFLGFVLAVAFGALSLYTEFWKQTSPLVEYELMSNTPVLDVREKLPDLEVLYQKQDIAKSGQTLSVLLVRIVNHSTANLLGTHYDDKAPIGLSVVSGKLIRGEILSTSNSYLAKAAQISPQDSSATFEPVILESNEWFLVKLLVLHDANTQPSISAFGKIAGMQSAPAVVLKPTVDKVGFWYRAFSGSVWTQIVRIAAYFVAAMLLIAAIVIPAESISKYISRSRRGKFISRYKSKSKLLLDNDDEYLFNGYVDGGLRFVQRLTNTLAEPELLNERVSEYLLSNEYSAIQSGSEDIPQILRNYGHIDIGLLIKFNFIKKVDEKWVAVNEHLKVATSFIDFIELIGAEKI